ncbi:unnamed protein product [Ambrosiozyma monospora]|uniref:Unnamed protein product n=1 Tax=Ambrosiozyma monospora TaxID=43982 RepID=A0ACB5STI2_AMBMO|nr:unnamed protein product [Ambrosiozyma monospora]
MYYGDFNSITEGCVTIEERIEKCRSAGLKKVRHVVTDNGLVFVTHKADECDLWDYYGGELEQFISGDKADCRSFPLRKRLVYECDYNFITFLDGYQECLHCKYTHPGLASIYPFEAYKVDNHTNFSRHHCNPKDGYNLDDGLFLYFFPSCALNKYAGGLGLFRCIPVSGNKTRMEFEYYFNGSDEDYEEYFKFARQVALEDIWLCEAAQKNLDMGLYPKGVLNPDAENGVVYYQKLLKQKMTS